MNDKKFYVTIKGKNFDEIAEENLKIEPDFFNSYTISKTELIIAVLDKVNNVGGFIVCCSEITEKKALKLYSEFNGKYYYEGIAGVLRKTIKLNLIENPSISDIQKIDTVTFDVKIQLTTKFDDYEKKPYFLATMLLYDKLKPSRNMVPANEEEIYDYMLLFWFKEQLQKACLKGLFKTYRYFECNDEKLRGAIDIVRHIKLNAGQNNGKVAYRYRENTANNYLNYLIVAAYTHLKEKYYDLVVENIDSNFDLLSVINQLKNVTGYTRGGLKSILSKNLRAITHPLYTEYEELRVTSIRILRDEGLSIFDGEDDDSQGILFYVPDLWENFLEKAMKKYVDCLKDNTVYLNSQVELYALSKPNIANPDKSSKEYFFFKTRPDYVFFNDKEKTKPIMVLDAKFRPNWKNALEDKNINSSLCDDYTKCIRDMCNFGVHATGVIFPFNGDNMPVTSFRHIFSCYNSTDSFYTIPLRVPSSKESDSYSYWRSKFEKYIAEDISAVDSILIEERKHNNIK